MKSVLKGAAVAAAVIAAAAGARAEDVLNVKNIGLDLARDVANATLLTCREMGYQTSVVVVDRSGIVRAALRDDLAAKQTLEIAERKANTVILSGTDTGQLRASRGDIRPELNHISGVIIMEGGVPIRVAGMTVGAVGVSGAPGGDIDAACANEAIDQLADRIIFAE